MKEMIAKEKSYEQNFRTDRYSNGQLAVFVQGFHDEPIAELSLMSDSVQLAPNEFILKDYSENEYFAKELIELGLINFTERFILIGSHLCPICQIQFEI